MFPVAGGVGETVPAIGNCGGIEVYFEATAISWQPWLMVAILISCSLFLADRQRLIDVGDDILSVFNAD